MAEQSKITTVFNWLADHPKTLRYLADNPDILRWIAKQGDNIDYIIKTLSRDSEGPIEAGQVTGIGLNIPNFVKGLGIGGAIGFLLGRGTGDNE